LLFYYEKTNCLTYDEKPFEIFTILVVEISYNHLFVLKLFFSKSIGQTHLYFLDCYGKEVPGKEQKKMMLG